jgi:nicotinamide-nucleotide amidase
VLQNLQKIPHRSFMVQNLNAEIIAIGTEILLGEITDTNSVHIARVLRDLGINLYFMTSVGDNEKRIADAIRIALSRADVVITCGGLGPTVDDMTRQAVAAATDRGLTFHQELLDTIAERFAGFRMKMTENNRQQAYLPDNAIVIDNPVGTAPSFIVEVGDGAVISLPGVPREMKFLIAERVIPYLHKRYQLGIIKAKVLRTAGIGESTLDDAIGKELLQASNPTVGLAAHAGQVDVRITAKADDEAIADQMIGEVEEQLRARIGQYVFGVDKQEIESVLVDLLRQIGGKIAICEAGIEDAVASRLRRVNGGDVMSITQNYENPATLQNALGINGNPSLRELAQASAESIFHQGDVLAAIVIVTRPDVNESADADEGTAIAIFTPDKSQSRGYGFGGKSENVRTWVSTWSMSWVWRMLKEKLNAG